MNIPLFCITLDGDSDPDHDWSTVFGVRGCVHRPDPDLGLTMTTLPTLGVFWTPYADWIYTVVSLSGVLLICWLVLGRSNP